MIERSSSGRPTPEEVARSLAAHLTGLRSWGIDRVRGAPPRQSAESSGDPERAPRDGEAQSAALEATARSVSSVRSGAARTHPVPRGTSDPAAALARVAEEIAVCERCRLCEGRTKTVPGVGDPRAPLLFVGEAPGRDEDLRGEPFVGRAGQLLDKIVSALGFQREEVHILNILKCRPPGNRDPQPDEVAACTPYLERQVELIAPRQIVALGRPSAMFLTGRDAPLARLRGGRHQYRGIPVVVTYHPAYLLRNPAAKVQCWQDLQAVVREFGRSPRDS